MLEEKDIKKLKQYGIYNIKMLDTLTINSISAKLSKALEKTLDTYLLDKENLFIKISRINMYYADFDEIHISAKYIPEYKAIFLKQDINIETLDSSILHECIHFLQSHFDEKDNLLSMGLLKKNKFKKDQNVALNEAATQLVASNVMSEKPSSVTYFDMYFSSPSQDYYPIETALLKQMMFFTGSYPLFYSTILGNNIFEETFKTITSEEVFNFISKNLDNLMFFQDEIAKLYIKKSKQNMPSFLKNYIKKRIDIVKINIQNTVLNIQDSIYQNCFNNLLNKVKTLSDCEDIKAELNSFSNLLIQREDEYSYSNYLNFALFVLAEKEKQLKLYNVVLDDNLIIKQDTYLPVSNKPLLFVKNMFNKFKLFLEVSFKKRLFSKDG